MIFFVSIGPSLAKNIRNADESVLANIKDQYAGVGSLDRPTSKDVTNITLGLKDSAAGHDEIMDSLVKKVASCIVEPLTHVLTFSLKTGDEPRDLKVTKVTLLFKSGDPNTFTNYRPISVLIFFPKSFREIS